jgi:hypothetical protein
MTAKFLSRLYVIIFSLSLLFSGCSKDTTEKSIVTDFTASFSSQYRGLELKGKIGTARQGITNITITSPETLKGLSVCYKNSEMEISQENLICSADEAYIPNNSFPSVVKEILSSVAKGNAKISSKSENSSTYSLKTAYGGCALSVDNKGLLTQIKCSNIDFEITFSDIK